MFLGPKPYLQHVCWKPDAVIDPTAYPFSIPAIRSLKNSSSTRTSPFLSVKTAPANQPYWRRLRSRVGSVPEGGTKNISYSTADTVSVLSEYIRISKGPVRPKDGYFLRAESFYNIATYMDDLGYLKSYGGKSLHARSHGEAFLALLTNKFQGSGIYFLDEPEAALSPNRQLSALCAIDNLVRDKSQFIIATHSPILLAYPAARIIQFSESGLQEITYEETEHYQITRRFLNDHCRYVKYLLGEQLPLDS